MAADSSAHLHLHLANRHTVQYLVLVAGALAVLSEALHSLVDKSYVLLVDVESQKSQSSCGAATDAVQELKGLTHQIVVVLVILVA